MAWSISHTMQAWSNVRARLMREWSTDEVLDALADEYFERTGRGSKAFRKRIGKLAHDILVDEAIECIERHNTCDNGGYAFWIDQEGYHRVSCSEPTIGPCGSCKVDTELVSRDRSTGMLTLACGCQVTPEIWTLEEY